SWTSSSAVAGRLACRRATKRRRRGRSVRGKWASAGSPNDRFLFAEAFAGFRNFPPQEAQGGRSKQRNSRPKNCAPTCASSLACRGLVAYIGAGGLRLATGIHIPGALSILKGAVPDLVRGLGHMAPTYFVGSRDRAFHRLSRIAICQCRPLPLRVSFSAS